MAASHIQAKSGHDSKSLTLDAAVTSGSLLAGIFTWGSADSNFVTSISDDKGNSYIILRRVTHTAVTQSACSFYLKNITNGPITITVTTGGANPGSFAMSLREAGGIDTDSPLDGEFGQVQDPTPGTVANGVTSSAVTTNADGEYIFAATVDTTIYRTANFSLGTGFTALSQVGQAGNYMCIATEHQIQASKGSIAGTFTQANSDTCITFIMTFKAGSTGTTGSSTGTGTAAGTVSGLGSLTGSAAGTSTMAQASSVSMISGSAAGLATTTGNTLAYYASLTGYSYGGWAAGIVILGWNANTESNLAGYRIYIGTSSGVYDLSTSRYTSPVNVGLVTTYTFSQLTGPTTYYFAITAFDNAGGESAFSSEISWYVPDYGVITGTLSNSVGSLTGSSTGTSIAGGVTYNIGALIGFSTGSGQTTGFAIANKAGAVAGLINASGAATATIGGSGRLANTFIVGSSTAIGTLDGSFVDLYGDSDGLSTADAILDAVGYMVAAAAGIGSASMVVSQATGVIQHQKRSPERGSETRYSRKR